MNSLEKPALRFRHEFKHVITKADGAELSKRLGVLFGHDSHAGPRGVYRVTSMYFDTPYDKALREKLESVDRREKFRLRYYGTDTSFIRLEKKVKLKGLCGKLGAKLEFEDACRILEGDVGFLAYSTHPLLVEFYSKLKGQLLAPKTVVSYEREAFLYAPGNVRVTIDRDLHSGSCATGFFDPAALSIPVSDGLDLLEVKYDSYLPDIVRMAVQTPNRRAAAFSKYAVCRRHD